MTSLSSFYCKLTRSYPCILYIKLASVKYIIRLLNWHKNVKQGRSWWNNLFEPLKSNLLTTFVTTQNVEMYFTIDCSTKVYEKINVKIYLSSNRRIGILKECPNYCSKSPPTFFRVPVMRKICLCRRQLPVVLELFQWLRLSFPGVVWLETTPVI